MSKREDEIQAALETLHFAPATARKWAVAAAAMEVALAGTPGPPIERPPQIGDVVETERGYVGVVEGPRTHNGRYPCWWRTTRAHGWYCPSEDGHLRIIERPPLERWDAVVRPTDTARFIVARGEYEGYCQISGPGGMGDVGYAATGLERIAPAPSQLKMMEGKA